MTLQEKFNNYFDTFFDEVSKIVPLSIPDKTTLSNDLFINYGSRELLASLEPLDVTIIFRLIANKFVPKWEKILAAQKEDFTAGVKTVETWGGADVTEYAKNDTNTETSQVTPYNDEAFTDSEKRTTTNTGTDTETRTKGTTKTTVVTDGKAPESTKTFIDYLQFYNTYDIINKEVAHTLTIMIRS